MIEIICTVVGCVLFFGGFGLLLYLAYKDMKKSEPRAERNADNLERIADRMDCCYHIAFFTDTQLQIIADLVNDRSLDEMRCCYGAEFIEDYDFYNSVAKRLNTYLFEAD